MITFQHLHVDMPALDPARLGRWVAKLAASHGREVGHIHYLFCDDDYILQTNRQYLSHDYYTDIITFDYTEGAFISGDLVISLDTVSSNARALGVSPEEELLRVIIHGVLHLCGINDKGPGEREIMEEAENQALQLYARI